MTDHWLHGFKEWDADGRRDTHRPVHDPQRSICASAASTLRNKTSLRGAR
jgi:hypothetical protein